MKHEGVHDKDQHISESGGEWIMSYSNNVLQENEIEESDNSINEFLEGTFFG